MMSDAEKNAATVRRAYQAFNESDMDTLAEIFDENVSWHTPGKSSVAGDSIGRDAVFAQFGRYGAESNGSFRAELKEVVWGPSGQVVGIHYIGGERKGKILDTDCCIVFQLKDGKIVDGREHFFDLHNWDLFWS